MWLGLIAGWLLGSATLYAYLVSTAKEPRREECMECHLTDCSECPFVRESVDQNQFRRAA